MTTLTPSMKLYADPTSTTSRAVLLFLEEYDGSGLCRLPVDIVKIDLLKGDHLDPAYAAINPNCAVPALVDGDFTLTEASTILKYLADMGASPLYPTNPRQRALINQRMDWFNTGFNATFGYGMVYTQAFPKFAYPNAVTQADVVRRAAAYSTKWLDVLDAHYLKDQPYLCGDQLTIADLLGVSYITIGDWVGFDFRPWPNVSRWIAAMRARPSWDATHEPWNGLVAFLQAQIAQPQLAKSA